MAERLYHKSGKAVTMKRSVDKQVSYVVSQLSAIGVARHGHQGSGQIHSLGTLRNYQQSFKHFGQWLRDHDYWQGLYRASVEMANEYLQERALTVGDKQLSLDRQALQSALSHFQNEAISLERPSSQHQTRGLSTQTRAYTTDQIQLIQAMQNPRDALATQMAYAAGLRAHELLTLKPAAEQPAATHRAWSEQRFSGRDGIRYSVIGKGGLVREILLPQALATQLEDRRLSEPKTVTDRGIHYQSQYDISGGQAWSQSVTEASQWALGWSQGAHGLRHRYAQQRMDELQGQGLIYQNALEIVSQELGHFRASITETYLR